MPGTIALDRPLPVALLHRVRTGWSAYRNYPAFSWPWLRRRTAMFALGGGAIAAVVGAGLVVTRGEVGPALALVGYFTAGVSLISAVGPALATAVRHRRWPSRREQPLLIAALLIGVIASAAIDGWASAGVDRSVAAAEHTPAPGERQAPGPVEAMIGIGLAISIYGALGGGLAVPRYLSELRQATELAHDEALAVLDRRHRELDARLGLLQAQIEPHFLFNTLASVHALIASDPAAAQALVDALVSYLRATIPRLRDAASRIDATLGQQLEICEAYLEVMRTRMGGRLTTRIEAPEELRAAVFPSLLLMTLVENSIKHGIEPKLGAGSVVIRASQGADGALEVRVIDDGVGLRDGGGGGLGLANLRDSLRARYGDQASFALAAGGGHTEATIRIPLPGRAPSPPRGS